MMLCQLGYTQGRVPQSPLPSFKFFQIRPIWEILFFNVIEKYALLQDCTCAVQTTRCHKIGAEVSVIYSLHSAQIFSFMFTWHVRAYYDLSWLRLILDEMESSLIKAMSQTSTLGKGHLRNRIQPDYGKQGSLFFLLGVYSDAEGGCCIGVSGVNSVGSFE